MPSVANFLAERKRRAATARHISRERSEEELDEALCYGSRPDLSPLGSPAVPGLAISDGGDRLLFQESFDESTPRPAIFASIRVGPRTSSSHAVGKLDFDRDDLKWSQGHFDTLGLRVELAATLFEKIGRPGRRHASTEME